MYAKNICTLLNTEDGISSIRPYSMAADERNRPAEDSSG